jgi:hypothetical protein
MAIPSSRQELVDYCLRSLGAPVLEINIDDDQIEDRVDDAIQFWHEYHADASVRTFLRHVITPQDRANKYIDLPPAVLSVTQLFNIAGNGGMSADMFNVQYQMFMNDLYGLRNPNGALVDFEMTRQYMNTIQQIISGAGQQVIYSRHQNRLYIKDDWDKYTRDGQYMIIECYAAVDPANAPAVYNDLALKRYLTALIKRQWGVNLIKFEGLQLLGGVTLNGRTILDEANAEITKLEEEWESKYSAPCDFFVG